jgi:hypothetical protein
LVALREGEKRPGLDEGVLVAVFAAAAMVERSIVGVQQQCEWGHVWVIEFSNGVVSAKKAFCLLEVVGE